MIARCFQPFLILIVSILILTGCSTDSQRPNVILLTLDTLRADALGCYGNESANTPVLDRLAREGVLFEDAICQIPATLTSHTALMTGRYPKTTGVRFRTHKVPEIEETLAELFRAHGYRTGGLISSYVLQPEFGLDQGFERYDLGSIYEDGVQVNSERRAEETIEEAIEYTIRHANESYFLWVHLYDPHTPYQAPESYEAPHDSDYSGPINGSVSQIIQLSAQQGANITEDDLEHLQSLYWNEVSYMDEQIGRLIEALESRGQLENTLIVAIADHGENLGEKGHFFHGDTLYRTEMQVPFIIRYPERIPAGQRIDPMVQTIDLFPTLLELTELAEVPAYVEGRSLASLISQSQEEPDNQPGYMETEADTVVTGNKLFGLRSETHKFIFNQKQRRNETPLGLYTEIPLQGPSIVLMRIQGDESIRLMVHVRYRTEELYDSKDFEALSKLHSTAIYAETFGTDPLHREAEQQDNFLKTPDGWRLQVTPDLYKVAKDYGHSRGWPTEWMVIEGVGVDASLPHTQEQGVFVVDQFELYTNSLRFPDSDRYRQPFWVIEDFEGEDPNRLVDAQEGPDHRIETEWTQNDVFQGKQQLRVEITFQDQEKKIANELYHLDTDPMETNNLLRSEETSQKLKDIANSFKILHDDWQKQDSGQPEVIEMDSHTREALESLGYTQR